MKKHNACLLSVTGFILFSAPVFGQVVNGGATGSIGGSVSGTLQRPGMDRMHSERDRIEQTGTSAAGKARQSTQATTERAQDRASKTKDGLSDRASDVKQSTSATAHGSVAATRSTAANAADSAAMASGSTAATANAFVNRERVPTQGEPPLQAVPAPEGGSQPAIEDSVEARGNGAADLLAGASAQTQPSEKDSNHDRAGVALDTGLSGSGAAQTTTSSTRTDSNARAKAGARREGTRVNADASASGDTNAQVNHIH